MEGYNKINKAVIVCSTIGAIQSKSSSKSQHHVVPVTFDYSTEKPKLKNQGNKVLEVDSEESFSNYINRVRIGMRTKSTAADYAPNSYESSDCGDEKLSDSEAKDEFSQYLDRARIKIRTTSSIPAERF